MRIRAREESPAGTLSAVGLGLIAGGGGILMLASASEDDDDERDATGYLLLSLVTMSAGLALLIVGSAQDSRTTPIVSVERPER